MQMFNQKEAVIDAGQTYLNSVLPFYALLALMFIFNSVLRGAGEMIIPMISSFISLWIARVPTAYLLAHFYGKNAIYYSYAIGWTIGLLMAFLSYKRGKWKKKSVVNSEKESSSSPERSTAEAF